MRIFLILWLCLLSVQAAPRVVVSIKPVHSLVTNVMAGVATPTLLMNEAGQSPHIATIKPSDVLTVETADLIVWIGSCYETGLITLIDRISQKNKVLTLIQHEDLIVHVARQGSLWGHVHSGPDGHIWLDPRNAKVIVKAVAEKLALIDPVHADQYLANAEATQERLDTFIQTLNQTMAPARKGYYIAAHDAYQYWDLYFGTECLGAVQAEPDIPASPLHLQRLQQKVTQLQTAGHAIVLLTEPQLPEEYTQSLGNLTGLHPIRIDPLGDTVVPGMKAYFDILTQLADTMAKTFKE